MATKYTKLDNTSHSFPDNASDDFQIDDDNHNEDILITPDSNSNTNKSPPNIASEPTQNSPIPIHIPQGNFKKTYEGGFFSINYYRQFFDINTSDFFNNCLTTMNPLSKPTVDEFNNVGDLYSSIWITASLIFLLFFCNSFASLLSGWFLGIDLGSLKINYFKMIVSSINLLYAYTILIPIILYLVLKFYYKVLFLVPLTKLISIYSYANLLWIPAVLLSIFRGLLVNHLTLDTILKWSCIIIGAIASGFSIIHKINFYFATIFGDDDKKSMYTLISLLMLAHAGFAIGVKVCFFGKL
jgi:hypothetical protein